jgi:hypothetical protein
LGDGLKGQVDGAHFNLLPLNPEARWTTSALSMY